MACEYKKEEIVQYLLSLPDVDVATTASNQSDTEPTDPDSHERGRTALHIAAAHNSLDTVKLLIEKDCPQIIQDKHVRFRNSTYMYTHSHPCCLLALTSILVHSVCTHNSLLF